MSTSSIFFEMGEEHNTARSNRPFLIFVEGTDDAHFLDVVLKEIKADPAQVGLILVGGIGQFDNQVKNHVKSSRFKMGDTKGIILIRDADDDAVTAENAIKAIFRKTLNVEVSNAVPTEQNGKKLGFYILPVAGEKGDLEKLCLDTVSGFPIERFAEAYIRNVEGHHSLENLKQRNKRKAHVYLAGIPGDLCRGVGLGFKHGHFEKKHELIDPLKLFLRTFLGLSCQVT
jgi:hypothetical protein